MEIEAEEQKKLKLSAEFFDQLSCPMEHDKQIIALLLTGITAVVEFTVKSMELFRTHVHQNAIKHWSLSFKKSRVHVI